MGSDLRWLLVFAGSALFHLVFIQFNHLASNLPFGEGGVPVFFFTLGLPVAFAALRLNLKQALAATIPTALLAESSYPVAPGTLLLPSVTCLCVTLSLRGNFNRFETMSAVITAIVINLVLMIVVSISAIASGGTSGSRLVLDILASQTAVVFLTTWFFAAQEAWLQMFGYSLDTELREPL
jgi:hypothetical protein